MAADHFCLRWNNYQSNMVSELDSLRSDEDLVDVTLSCEGYLLKAHKVILSACSSYFRNVFKENPCKHPVVILKGVNHEDVEALLSFIYQGIVYISEKKLASFLQTAELLQIRGLTGATNTVKEDSSDQAINQNKISDKNNVPPPPQLLTANLINSWKQQEILNDSCSLNSRANNPPSPLLSSTKRKKLIPYKISLKDNFECSDTNSNQDFSETDSDLLAVKSESAHIETGLEDDCNSSDEMSREEPIKQDNPTFFDNMESDETEDENGDISKTKSGILSSEKYCGDIFSKSSETTNSNASCSSIFNLITNYNSSQSEQNSSSESKWRCMLPQECKICHKTFSNAGNLRQHITNVHTPGQPVQCELCFKEFKNKEYLRKHKVIIHKAPLRKHKVSFPFNQTMIPWNYWAHNYHQ